MYVKLRTVSSCFWMYDHRRRRVSSASLEGRPKSLSGRISSEVRNMGWAVESCVAASGEGYRELLLVAPFSFDVDAFACARVVIRLGGSGDEVPSLLFDSDASCMAVSPPSAPSACGDDCVVSGP